MRIERKHAAQIAKRTLDIGLAEIHIGAPVPAFRIGRCQIDHLIQKLQRQLRFFRNDCRLRAVHQHGNRVIARRRPKLFDRLADRFSLRLVGRSGEQGVQVFQRSLALLRRPRLKHGDALRRFFRCGLARFFPGRVPIGFARLLAAVLFVAGRVCRRRCSRRRSRVNLPRRCRLRVRPKGKGRISRVRGRSNKQSRDSNGFGEAVCITHKASVPVMGRWRQNLFALIGRQIEPQLLGRTFNPAFNPGGL